MGCDPLTFPLLLLLLLLKPPVVFLLFALHFKPRQKLVLQHHISEHLYLHRFSNRMSVSSHWQCVLSSFYHGVWLSAKENGSSRTVWVSVDSQLRCLTHTHTRTYLSSTATTASVCSVLLWQRRSHVSTDGGSTSAPAFRDQTDFVHSACPPGPLTHYTTEHREVTVVFYCGVRQPGLDDDRYGSTQPSVENFPSVHTWL